MSLSSKSSRHNSLSSLFNLGNNQDNVQNDRTPQDEEQTYASGIHEEGPPHANRGNYKCRHNQDEEEDNNEPPRYLTYTQNHPMGRLFLALYRENGKKY
jgi:hypothetical protein